jgi:hypothetical protein
MNVEKVVYIDATDFKYELEHAAGGNTVYPSLEDLKKNNRCWNECGVVKCKIVLEEWIIKEDWEETLKNAVQCSVDDIKNGEDQLRLEGAKRHLSYLEEKVEQQKNRISYYETKIKENK